MTYLVINLASCLFFAQLLGLLLGWLLWGYVSVQRKKEIVMLRKRLADTSLQTLKPLEEPVVKGTLAGSRDWKKAAERLPLMPEAVMGDLPPLATIPEETAPAKAESSNAIELQRQVETLKSQLSSVSAEKETHTAELKGQIEALTRKLSAAPAVENTLLHEVDQLKAQLVRVNAEKAARAAEYEQRVKALTAEINSTSAERDRGVFEAKALRTELEQRVERSADLERRINALNSELNTITAEKEKSANELKNARADFEKRSAWLTKRIHELERSAEEWERTKQELTLSRRVDQHKPRGDNNGASEASEAALTELRDRLARLSSERDALASELSEHKNGAATAVAPDELSELQEQLRKKDAQLTEQVARVERLLWRVSELESATGTMPQLEETLKSKDARIAALMEDAAERDAHIRTLLRRMTELEPLNEKIDALKAEMKQREETGPQAARLRELEELLASKEAEIAGHVSAQADNQAIMAQLSGRLAELERVAAHAAVMESSLREKQEEIGKLHASQAEQDLSVAMLRQRLGDVEARAEMAEQHLSTAQSEAEQLRSQLDELMPLPAKMQDLADKHHSDLTRLKTSSAQRIRRLRQGITNFKG